MRLANVEGRACAVFVEGGVDLAAASSGMFSSLVDDVIPLLSDVASWLESAKPELDPRLATEHLQ